MCVCVCLRIGRGSHCHIGKVWLPFRLKPDAEGQFQVGLGFSFSFIVLPEIFLNGPWPLLTLCLLLGFPSPPSVYVEILVAIKSLGHV